MRQRELLLWLMCGRKKTRARYGSEHQKVKKLHYARLMSMLQLRQR